MNKFYFLMVLAVILFSTNLYPQQWVQIGEDIDGVSAGDQFGNAIDVSANGNIIAIGGFENDDNGDNSGHVRIFENIEGSWTQIGEPIIGESGEKMGYCVSLNHNGDIVALSSPYYDSNRGKVGIYQNNEGAWSQIGDFIYGIDQYNSGGISIDFCYGDTIIAVSNHAGSGIIRLFKYSNSNWELTDEIKGILWNEQLGRLLEFSADGSVLAAYSPVYKMVKLFTLNQEDDWVQFGDSIPNVNSSFSISADGYKIAIGDAGWFGKVNVYQVESDTLIRIGNEIGGWFTNTGFAGNVKLNSNGNKVLVSASGYNFSTGLVRTYSLINNEWVQLIDDLHGEGQYDNFGTKICLNANDSILVISGPQNDEVGDNSGHVRVFRYWICDTIKNEFKTTICNEDLPYYFGNNSIFESGTYIDTLIRDNGCDSIVTLLLTILKTQDSTTNISVCDSEIPYIFGKQSLDSTGIYSEIFESQTGCDSTVILYFTVNNSFENSVSDTIQYNELPYTFGSQILDTAGIYSEVFVASNGCDSIVTLSLVLEDIPDNIEYAKDNDIFSLIYNPTSEIMTLEFKNQMFDNIQLSLYDLTGKLLLQNNYYSKNSININLSNHSIGIYTLIIKVDNRYIFRKLVLNR